MLHVAAAKLQRSPQPCGEGLPSVHQRLQAGITDILQAGRNISVETQSERPRWAFFIGSPSGWSYKVHVTIAYNPLAALQKHESYLCSGLAGGPEIQDERLHAAASTLLTPVPTDPATTGARGSHLVIDALPITCQGRNGSIIW